MTFNMKDIKSEPGQLAGQIPLAKLKDGINA